MANDDSRQTLDIPNGTTFEFRDGKLIFGHESDIVIRTNMGGYKFQKIFSKRGSVQVIPPEGVEFDVDEIEATNGDIFFTGRVRARSVRAKTVHFQDGTLAADKIDARDEVVLSGKRIDVTHVKAPRVVLDSDADGTCLVVESQNDPGRFRARGGFRSIEEAREALDRLIRVTGGAPAVAEPPMARPEPAVEPPAARFDSTEEFRAFPRSETDSGSAALPKSSVFRKRS